MGLLDQRLGVVRGEMTLHPPDIHAGGDAGHSAPAAIFSAEGRRNAGFFASFDMTSGQM